MRILAIETSFDETGAAVIEGKNGRVKILSNIIASSLSLHAKTGGIIPEAAAREQVKYVIPVIKKALQGSTRGVDALNPAGFIHAIAVTVGPGLVGSLLVGVETAKTLAFIFKKPIIPVNHLIGHMYANFISEKSKVKSQKSKIIFPAVSLVVSGGHTDLVLMTGHGKIKWLGGTRDDAAGEAFDKIGRLLGFPYPGGPAIAAEAAKFEARNRAAGIASGDARPKSEFKMFPRPMIDSQDFDFSFSGLKTAVLREVKAIKQLSNETIIRISAEAQSAIVDVLVTKTIKAAKQYKVKSVLLSGGVAANDLLRNQLEISCQQLAVKFFKPAKNLCTDNAAMIASASFFNYKPVAWSKITALPGLHFSHILV